MSPRSTIDASSTLPTNESCGATVPLVPEPRAEGMPDAHLPRPTVPPRILHGSDELQIVLGHSPRCVSLSRQGAISSCDCRIRALPDPAIVIGMIIRFVRATGHGRRPLPLPLTELLALHLQQGDPSCRVIAHWLVGIGLIEHRILPWIGRRPQ